MKKEFKINKFIKNIILKIVIGLSTKFNKKFIKKMTIKN